MSAVETTFLLGLGISALGMMVHSFYEAKHIPTCWPDGRSDFRIPFGIISLISLANPYAALIGIPILLAIMLGSFPGWFLKHRKLRDERWAQRPNKLSSKQHRAADDLEFTCAKLLNRMDRKFSSLDPATDVGREEMESAARSGAKEFNELTGLDIEKNIDDWLSQREELKKILEREGIKL